MREGVSFYWSSTVPKDTADRVILGVSLTRIMLMNSMSMMQSLCTHLMKQQIAGSQAVIVLGAFNQFSRLEPQAIDELLHVNQLLGDPILPHAVEEPRLLLAVGPQDFAEFFIAVPVRDAVDVSVHRQTDAESEKNGCDPHFSQFSESPINLFIIVFQYFIMNKKELRKLNHYVDKEVLNLTGGLYPMALFTQNKQNGIHSHTEWVQENIKLKNNRLLGIKVWVPKEEAAQVFPGEKFNVDVEYIEPRPDELEPCEGWTYEETVKMMQDLRGFNYNFIILHDRQESRDIYQLKDRYYSVMREVLHKRGMVNHQLYNYQYDAEYDRFRNAELEKYLKRTKAVNEEEKKLMEELRKIDQQIRKQEKEHRSLAKCMNLMEVEELDEKQVQHVIELFEKNEEVKNKTQERFVYLRSRWINEALPIPTSIQKKLENQLKELLPSNRLVLNEEFEQLSNKLRQAQLALMSQQRLEKRRENEKKMLEEKLEKLRKQRQAEPPR